MEGAFVMSMVLMACLQLFYWFSLMEFQAEVQLALEQECRERAIYQICHGIGMGDGIRQELSGGLGLLSLGQEGVSVSLYPVENDYLEAAASYRAGPLFNPWKGTYVQTCRRRLWSGQETILDAGREELGDEGEGVYITLYGSAWHKTRECAYLSLSVRPVPAASVSSLRNAGGGRYTACGQCVGAAGLETVYITDYGSRYHGSRTCSGISRWIIKVPLFQAEGRTPCGKCSR